MNRRSFLETLAALGTASGWRGVGGSSGSAPRSARLETIGLQLYSVRRAMERDFEGTLGRVSSLGYREVEFAGYFERRPQAVKTILDRLGLVAPSAHVPIESARQDWASALESANVIGHRYVVVPWLPEEGRRTLDDYRRVAEEFNRLGAAAKSAGLRFAYHNHDFEFAPLDGRIPYDVLLAETDSGLVAFELDLLWIIKGGQDPLTYFSRYPGRFEMVHVKDSTGPPEYRQVDVGRGIIDFRSILAQHVQAGIRHAFVEHDDPADPLAFARASHVYLDSLHLGGRATVPRRKANP